MSETAKSRAATLAHLRSGGFAKGDPIPLPLTMASIFHSPGDATGFDNQGAELIDHDHIAHCTQETQREQGKLCPDCASLPAPPDDK